MIAVIDYGAGNLFSVTNALKFLGLPHQLTGDAAVLCKADGLILPGVGAFPAAMEKLSQSALRDCIVEQAKRKPLLGICLGMQMLFDRSFEFGETPGLGLIPGEVRPMRAEGSSLKIPHMGWNSLQIAQPCPLLLGVEAGSWAYFAHSFRVATDKEYLAAWVEYGEEIPALVCHKFTFGAQFHPEKSGTAGLKILQNFSDLCEQQAKNPRKMEGGQDDTVTGN